MEVRLKNITKRFGDVIAVNQVNFKINEGEFLVLLGPSGCGKTTALRMVAGLETIDEGDIYIGERRVNDVLPKYRDVAMVFQSYALYPHMTVADNIGYPLKLRGVSQTERQEAIVNTAQLVGLGDLLNRYPKQLSGGQRQRVALARAIVRRPKVFLMDEPLSNLDAKLRGRMRAELKHLQHDLGITTIYVTHDQIEAMTLAQRVAIMRQGVLQQIGTPKNVYNDPGNLFVAGFIGSPTMNFLNGDLRNGDFVAPGCHIKQIGKGSRQKVILGVRPEDMKIVENAESHIEAVLYSVELTGDQTIVTAKLGESDITVREDKDYEGVIDQTVKIKLDESKVFLFDAKTGHRIRSTVNDG
ncbi:MAG: ABC transporter ATP-binding protein [Desulfobacteraceae bacterium]|jgi:multiple sugar transport system ATP-binding protein|nr:ABC transporter ATP-binding protein [Desulfobacteraceae bacterium]